MRQEQLNAIKERVKKASVGPWIVIEEEFIQNISNVIGAIHFSSDAHFIACSREDVPALVAEVERLNNQIHVYKVTDEFVREQSKKVKHLFSLDNVAGYGQLCDLVVEQDKEIKRLHYKLRQTKKRRENNGKS